MKSFFNALLALLMTLTNLNIGFAAGSSDKPSQMPRAESMKLFLATIPQILKSPKQLEFALPYTNIRKKDFQPILDDLNKNMNGEVAEVRLIENQFYIDKKATGIRVASYDPLKIEYKSKKWQFDRKATPIQNYSSLIKTLEMSDVASLTRFFLPEAEAGERENRATKYGLAAATVAGGLLYIASAEVSVPITLLIVLVGGAGAGAAGAAYGHHDADKEIQNQKAWIDAMLKSPNLQVDCQPESVTIWGKYRNQRQFPAVRLDRIDVIARNQRVRNAETGTHPGMMSRAWDWAMSFLWGKEDNTGQVQTYVSRNLCGANPAECPDRPKQKADDRSGPGPIQRNSSFDKMFELDAAQSMALNKALNCTDLNEWENYCLAQKLQSCKPPEAADKTLSLVENMALAQKYGDCLRKGNSEIDAGKCVLPILVSSTYRDQVGLPPIPTGRPTAK